MNARPQLYTLMACGHWSSWNAPDREPQVGVLYWCDQHGDTDELVVCAHVAQAHHYVEETAPKLERQPGGWATGKRRLTPHGPGYYVMGTDHDGNELPPELELHVVKHGQSWSGYAGDELVVDGRATRGQAANRLAWELADRARRA